MAFGALLDSLSQESERKQAIERLLKQYTTANNFTDAFYAHINLINEIFFERFFGMPFLSTTYFLRCAIFSLVSLVVVISLQYIHDPSPFNEIHFSPLQIFVLAFCAIANFVIDWLSIGLTQMFIRISSGLKNIYHSIILIFVDLVLTINTFSLVYALPIAVLLFLSDLLPAKVNLIIHEYDFSGLNPKSQSVHHLDWSVNSASHKGKPETLKTLLPEANTADFHFTDAFHSGAFPEVEQSDVKIFSIPIGDILSESMAHAVRVSGYNQLHSTDSLLITSQFRVAPSLTRANWSMAYSNAYRFSESAQQSFPEDISLYAMFAKLGDLVTGYAATKGKSEAFAYCRRSENSPWQLKAAISTAHSTHCVQDGSVRAYDVNGLFAEIRKNSFDMGNVYIPINSVFMTSICMTALIYFFTLFLIVFYFSKTNTFVTLSKYQSRIVNAPFMTIGFFVGVLATIAYELV